MNIAVPFGQYISGTTPVHTLDARAKLAVIAGFSVALFVSSTWWGMGACALIVIAAYAIARVPLRLALRGLKPILFLLIITLLVNAIAHVGPEVPNISGWGITLPGLLRGLYFATRIVLLIITTSLLTYTTSPVQLTDALVSLMRPLAAIRVPIEDIAMMFSIALRFIPTTVDEADKIITAQSARGAKFDDENLYRRIKAWIPVLTPLFVNLFRRADSLAMAMESRCYTGQNRTHLRETHIQMRDIVVMLMSVLLTVAISIWL